MKILKQIAYDTIALDQGQIVEDSKCCLKVNAIIARNGVYQYEDGKALKSKQELLKATRTARYAKLTVGNHPSTQVIMSQTDLHGGVEKPFFDNGKLRAILSFDKEMLSTETIDKIRSAINTKTGIDNSIGFYYDADWTSGTDKNVNTDAEEKYDYIMRNIVIDHVAVITDNQNGRLHGRCQFPKCGIGADCLTCPRKIGKTFSSMIEGFKKDVIEKRGDKWCVMHCHGPEAGTPIKCFDTEAEAEAMHRAIEAQKHGSSVLNNGGKQTMSENKQKTDVVMDPEKVTADYKKCVAERMKLGYSRGQAEAHCFADVKPSDETAPPAPVTTDVKKTDETVEQTPLARCITAQVEQGKTQAEAEAWCKADLAGEHETVDSLMERTTTLLRLKAERDIERAREQRRHPV